MYSPDLKIATLLLYINHHYVSLYFCVLQFLFLLFGGFLVQKWCQLGGKVVLNNSKISFNYSISYICVIATVLFLVSRRFNIITKFFRKSVVASRVCKYRGYNASILMNVIFIICMWNRTDSIELLSSLKQKYRPKRFVYTNMLKRILPGKHYEENCTFTSNCLLTFFLAFVVCLDFYFFLLQSGDIELNPGPYSDADSSIYL